MKRSKERGKISTGGRALGATDVMHMRITNALHSRKEQVTGKQSHVLNNQPTKATSADGSKQEWRKVMGRKWKKRSWL